jgi:hypothetical protein
MNFNTIKIEIILTKIFIMFFFRKADTINIVVNLTIFNLKKRD